MISRQSTVTALVAVLSALLFACAPPDGEPPTDPSGPQPALTQSPVTSTPNSLTLAETARATIEALSRRDFTALAKLVHAVEGVRLSPYAYVNPETDLVFSAEEILSVAQDEESYRWGYYDGSGEPIDLTFMEYYDRFVYDADFADAEQVGYNTQIGSGNTINNAMEVYPDSVFVEYHFAGFEAAYAGLDWRSLRLVFRRQEGDWRLIGIVHDQWTI